MEVFAATPARLKMPDVRQFLAAVFRATTEVGKTANLTPNPPGPAMSGSATVGERSFMLPARWSVRRCAGRRSARPRG